MAQDKSGSADSKVKSIAEARRERLNNGSIAYGRRSTDDAGGPNAAAQREQTNVRSMNGPKVCGRRFNQAKVNRIKSEIKCGDYKIDALRVADLFIEHERHK